MTAIGFQGNQAKHKLNYFQAQTLKAGVPQCAEVIIKMNYVADEDHTNDWE